jgi:hypothetical protein
MRRVVQRLTPRSGYSSAVPSLETVDQLQVQFVINESFLVIEKTEKTASSS